MEWGIDLWQVFTKLQCKPEFAESWISRFIQTRKSNWRSDLLCFLNAFNIFKLMTWEHVPVSTKTDEVIVYSWTQVKVFTFFWRNTARYHLEIILLFDLHLDCCNKDSVISYKEFGVLQSPAVVMAPPTSTNDDVISLLSYLSSSSIASPAVQLWLLEPRTSNSQRIGFVELKKNTK